MDSVRRKTTTKKPARKKRQGRQVVKVRIVKKSRPKPAGKKLPTKKTGQALPIKKKRISQAKKKKNLAKLINSKVSRVGNRRKKNFSRLQIGLTVFFLCALIAGVFYFYINNLRNPRVLGVEEMIEMEVPEWYTQALVVSQGERSLSVTPLAGSNVKVEQTDNQYIYRDAYPHTDVVQTKYHYKIKEELIFKEPGHPIRFQYRLGNIEDYYIEEDEEGNIIFYDRVLYEEQGIANDLSRVFTIPTPFIEDSRKQRSFLAVEVVIEDDLLIVEVDQNWVQKSRYPMTLDPTIEINVLNVHSHPAQGENWEVSFTTQGRADLRIIPDDQATIDDDEFVSLWCGDEERIPQILENDVIYYPDWHCDGIGKVVHYTLKAGHHRLKFDFGGVIAYAYNATVSVVASSEIDANDCDPCTIDNFNISGTSATMLLVFVSGPDGAKYPLTGAGDVTWSVAPQQNFTVINQINTDDGAQCNTNSTAYFLESPNIGTGDISVDMNAADKYVMRAVALEGTKTGGLGTSITDYTDNWDCANNGDFTATDVASDDDDMIFDVVASQEAAITPDASQTVIYNQDSQGSGKDGGASYKQGNGTDDMFWDINGQMAGLAFNVEAAVSAPIVTNTGESGVTDDSATLNGDITATGGENATGRGFAWGTDSSLANGDTATTTEWGSFPTGTFSENLSSLTCNENYYYRAWAQNSAGTSTASAIEPFTTSACAAAAPTITQVSATSTRPGNPASFYVNWNDADSGEQVKVKICQTNLLTNQNCPGGWFASSTAFTTADPVTVSTSTASITSGWKQYWAFVCDDEGACSDGYPGSFYLGYITQIDPSGTGTTTVNSPITQYYAEGLVGHWTFNGQDMGTTSAQDASGNNNIGWLINGPKKVIGKVGQGLQFDGTDDYVDIGTGPTSVNTIAFWIYPQTTTEYFINFNVDPSYIWVSGGTVTATGFSGSETEYVNGAVSDSLSAGEWQHVAITDATAENASNLDIARTEDTNYLEGKIDEVRLYNRVLDASEIQALYRTGARKLRR